MAQDDYYYEIQLTNKQLVFYFMAGAAGLILSFLAGVMVGRGVDGGAQGVEPTRQVVEEKVVTEQTPAPAATDYSYPQLASEKAPEGLEKTGAGTAPPAATVAPAPSAAASGRPTPGHTTPAHTVPARPAPSATPSPAVAATPSPASPTPRPTPPTTATHAPGLPKPIGSSVTVKGFAVQVGAFKDRTSAEGVVKSLKARGLPAYTVAPAGGGLFTVRVGVYRDRADAEAVKGRLRDDKFNPYIFKQ